MAGGIEVRWAVELIGEDADLQDARTLFASGTVRIETIKGNTIVLMADDFESLTDALQVREAAKNLIDLINGALFLHDAERRPLQVGSIVREKRDGEWKNHHVLEAETGRFRTKFFPLTVSQNGTATPAAPPPERKWFQDAKSDDVVADVLTYLRAKPDWFELYKAFERMRDDINRRLGQHQSGTMGWPSATELDYFTESATVHRHSPPKWGRLNPTTAMKIDDARLFIRRLAQIWLSWRPNAPPPRE